MGFEESFVRVPTSDGSTLDVPLGEWTLHPTRDVAAIVFEVPDEATLFSTSLDMFIDAEAWLTDGWFNDPFTLRLGNDVFFVGMLAHMPSLRDAAIPIVRAGTLGAIWQRNLPVRYTPTGPVQIIDSAHLIDCRSFGGFSGSPCYVQQHRAGVIGGGITTKYRTALLGMIGGHFDDWVLARDEEGSTTAVKVAVNTGVGYVIPAEHIRELLTMIEGLA